jgi:hypothetical protein
MKAIIQGTEWTYLTADEVGKEFVIGINRGVKRAYATNGTGFSHQLAGQNMQPHNLRRPHDTLVSSYNAIFLEATPSSRHHPSFSSPPALSPVAVATRTILLYLVARPFSNRSVLVSSSAVFVRLAMVD